MRFGRVLKEKDLLLILILILILVSIVVFNMRNAHIKNIIMMIPDGTSISHVTLSRLCNGGKNLAIDEIITGLAKTQWRDGTITDSAAAGTAFSTGNRTDIGCVSVVLDRELNYAKPVATIVEGARKIGKSTGIVCTSNLNDATPAAFSSHVINRRMWNTISEQQVYSGIDVFLGGGSEWYFSGNKKYNRKDGRVLKNEIVDRGYDFVTTKEEMDMSKSNKIWGAFSQVELQLGNRETPTIEDMTKKAIDILSRNNNGFFLLVEGSKIDWCSHYNDARGVINEMLDFDKSVNCAIEFAKSRNDTVVIVCPDHGNGGLSIGTDEIGNNYGKEKLETIINSMDKVKAETEIIIRLLNKDKSNLRDLLKEYCGIDNLKENEERRVKKSKRLRNEINRIISKKAGLGWTTRGHTGEDVFLGCYHPKDCVLRGVIHISDINNYMMDFFCINLERLSEELFIEARGWFRKKGYKVLDEEGKEMVVKKGKNILRLQYNKDIAFLNGKEIKLDGINVYTGEYLFVSRGTLEILEKN